MGAVCCAHADPESAPLLQAKPSDALPVRQGALHMKERWSTWPLRFVALFPEGVLRVYADAEDLRALRNPVSSIDLNGSACLFARPPKVTPLPKHACLELCTPRTTLFFSSPNEPELVLWARALQEAAARRTAAYQPLSAQRRSRAVLEKLQKLSTRDQDKESLILHRPSLSDAQPGSASVSPRPAPAE